MRVQLRRCTYEQNRTDVINFLNTARRDGTKQQIQDRVEFRIFGKIWAWSGLGRPR